MPGVRLTHEDRREIEAALADGHGYAEIARRLGRPTSTISREVGRNGGDEEYTADRAHQAAIERARRRPTDDADGRDRAAVKELADRLAEMMVETGFPRMMARVLVCLILDDTGHVTATELVDRLRVSPAAVSKAVQSLENLDLVKRERDPIRRREVYLLDDSVWRQAWAARAQSMTLWSETAQRGVEVYGAETPAGRRLLEMSEFFSLVHRDLRTTSESAPDRP